MNCLFYRCQVSLSFSLWQNNEQKNDLYNTISRPFFFFSSFYLCFLYSLCWTALFPIHQVAHRTNTDFAFFLLSGSGWNITILRATTGNSKSHLVSRHWCHKIVHLCSEADPNRALSKRDSLITIAIPFAIHPFPWVLWNTKQIC